MSPTTALDFETLVDLYYQPVFKFAVTLCGKIEWALELTQHTFCLALSRQAYFQGPDTAKGWLLTLLFREFLKTKLDRACASPHQPSVEPGKPAAASAKMRLKDLSHSQIAEYLGIPVNAVLTRLVQGHEEFSLAAPGHRRRRHRLRRRRIAQHKRHEPVGLAV